MLRDCGFAHIGAMLAQLLSADVHGGPDDDATAIPSTPFMTAAIGLDPSSLTEKQAIAVGCAIASCVHEAHTLAAGLKRVTKSHAVLQAMKSEHNWFMPMLEGIMAHKAAQRRGSAVMERLRSSISPVASSDAALHADAADEESGFSSVVRLGAHGPVSLCTDWLGMPCGPRLAFLALPANSKGTPPQVPADALASEVVDSMPAEPVAAAAALGHDSRDVGSDSEVPDFCTTVACCYALCHYGTLWTCAGPRRSEQQRQRSASTCDATRTPATLVCVAGYNGIDRC
jgi:hypothetical protein